MNRRHFVGLGTTLLFSGCIESSSNSPSTATSSRRSSDNTATAAPTNTTKTTEEATSISTETTNQRGRYEPLTKHYFSDSVTYHSNQLRLHTDDDIVHVGETIQFKITNIGDSTVTLGCHNPTTIQKQVDKQWRDVVWTSDTAFAACATVLQAGKSTIKKITISKDALESRGEEVRVELGPGQYRFVILSTNPYLAEKFSVRAKIH